MAATSLSENEPGVAEAFRLPDAARLRVRTLANESISVTEIQVNRNGFGMTEPIPYQDAGMLAVQLRAIAFHEAMTDDKPVPVYDIRPGDTLFYDMRRDPRANVMTRSHSLHFVLPRKLIQEIAAAIEGNLIDGFRPATGDIVRDVRLARLARSILPVLRNPERASALFTSHFALALGIYACWRYGGMLAPQQPTGELCKLQIRLSQEIIAANLDGGIALGEVASLCGLPTRRFLTAFRDTLGMSPYQWLQVRRLELARTLLRGRKHEIVEIATLCGFADEAHFSGAFSRATGLTPVDWLERLQ
jgi:AraC-like DNA-binding protein